MNLSTKRDTTGISTIMSTLNLMTSLRAPIRVLACSALAVSMAACAGRDPQPVAISQMTDSSYNCDQIRIETDANNQKIANLAGEKGRKMAQNIAAGTIGLFVPVLWFAMDFKGAAATEQKALQDRNAYLASLAGQRCGGNGTTTTASR